MSQKLLKIVFFISIIPLIGFSNGNPEKGKYEKSKTIHKEFSVNSDALLDINNKYGNVDIVSWDQNRIVIDVKITVNGNNESKVNQKLGEIDVDFSGSKSVVSAKTIISKKGGSWNNNVQLEINYTVKMPITNSADLNNDYGSISLNELQGQASINCDYGKIIIGSLFHANNSINIDYTNNSNIEYMEGGSINADYSSFTVEKAKNIDLNADYTTSVFENLEDLNFNCDYGKVEVRNGNNIIGNGDYLTMHFGDIYKKLHVESDYGSIKVGKLMKGFDSVNLNTEYTGIKVGMESGIAFSFMADLSYSGLDIDLENVTYSKKIVKSSSKYYEGKVNNATGNSRIEISSDYGGVKFYQN